MSARGPRWLTIAVACYALVLRLYPRDLREAHGEEMRQVFRDRCREVAAGRVRAWRLLSLELLPDLLASVAQARMEERGSASPRALAGIVLLALLALVLIFQESLSPRINDSWFGISARWQHWRAERALLRDEAQVRRVAEALAASANVADRALAAYLYRANEQARGYEATYAIASEPKTFEPLTADGERASRLLAMVPTDPGLEAAGLAARACVVDEACDRLARVQALIRSEPDNAYGWALLLKLHSLAGDEAAVAADLRRIAGSTRYDDGVASDNAAAFSAVSRLAPGDAQAMAGVARRLRVAAIIDKDFRHGLQFHCSIAVNGRSAWLRAHPEGLADCRSAAELLSNSKAPRASDWGWRWRVLDDGSPENRAGLDVAWKRVAREVWDVGWAPTPDPTRGRPWTDAEWQAWALAKVAESGR